jgi:hypothetical protein
MQLLCKRLVEYRHEHAILKIAQLQPGSKPDEPSPRSTVSFEEFMDLVRQDN